MNRTLPLLLALALGARAQSFPPAQGQLHYTVTDLGAVPGPYHISNGISSLGSEAHGINNLGHVTGETSNDNGEFAMLYKDGKMQIIGPVTALGVPQQVFGTYNLTQALGVNLFDQIAGEYSYIGTNSSGGIGFIYTPGLPLFSIVEKPVQFPLLTEFRESLADSINVFGESVGNVVNPQGDPNAPFANPFVLRGGVIVNLSLFPGATNQDGGNARGINNLGEIVGEVNVEPLHSVHAVYYDLSGKIYDVGTFGPNTANYYQSTATAINDHGWIVGSGTTSAAPYDANDEGTVLSHAFLCYSGTSGPGSLIDLGVLLGLEDSYATGINNSGVIVGYCTGDAGVYTYGEGGFIYVKGVMQALNDLLINNPGWNIDEAAAINDLGQIAATGTITINGLQVTHALLLNPVRE
jgi:uncharacterized membrane protein